MSKPLEAVVIGAGARGYDAYAPYALSHPDELKFVAVAEPDKARRERFAQRYNVPRENCFTSWEELTSKGQLADAAFNCTQDAMHIDSTLALLKNGYHVLLEKPMATTPEDCLRLTRAAEDANRILQICHVLRFTSFFSKIHEIITSGRLGDIITVEHRENVVYWHMAHSFVRGSWRNSEQSTPMILAKCCHDLDILFWNLGNVRRLSSVGSLIHFRKENAPQGATKRCTDGCPAADTCLYDARRIYLRPEVTGWPVSVISVDTSMPARQKALETGPYGRCVYACDNNVVDHQTVSMELESGASVTLFMHGHSYQEGRTMRYDGTRATLRGKFTYGMGEIEIHDHLTNRVEQITPDVGAGHGGGDAGLVASFVKSLRSGSNDALTSARNSMESHLMAFAAEKARIEGNVISMPVYKQSFNY
ncbi:MAG TPA: Gfo/Idh/MocA family oxidoreductase [Anaerolineaceae bacterium]